MWQKDEEEPEKKVSCLGKRNKILMLTDMNSTRIKRKRILGEAAEREIFCVMNRNKFCSFNFRSMWERNPFTLENTDQVARPLGRKRLITSEIDH